jgi:DNA-binding NtrC family response regulator
MIVLPRISGTQFVRAARERWPDLPVIYITGYTDPRSIAHGVDVTIVKKPHRAPGPLRAIERALNNDKRHRQISSQFDRGLVPMIS